MKAMKLYSSARSLLMAGAIFAAVAPASAEARGPAGARSTAHALAGQRSHAARAFRVELEDGMEAMRTVLRSAGDAGNLARLEDARMKLSSFTDAEIADGFDRLGVAIPDLTGFAEAARAVEQSLGGRGQRSGRVAIQQGKGASSHQAPVPPSPGPTANPALVPPLTPPVYNPPALPEDQTPFCAVPDWTILASLAIKEAVFIDYSAADHACDETLLGENIQAPCVLLEVFYTGMSIEYEFLQFCGDRADIATMSDTYNKSGVIHYEIKEAERDLVSYSNQLEVERALAIGKRSWRLATSVNVNPDGLLEMVAEVAKSSFRNAKNAGVLTQVRIDKADLDEKLADIDYVNKKWESAFINYLAEYHDSLP